MKGVIKRMEKFAEEVKQAKYRYLVMKKHKKINDEK